MDVVGPGAGSFLRECLVTQVTWVGLYPGIQPDVSERVGEEGQEALSWQMPSGGIWLQEPKVWPILSDLFSPVPVTGDQNKSWLPRWYWAAKGMPPVPTLTGSTEATQFMVGKPLELLILTGYSLRLHRKRAPPGLESPRQLAEQISIFKFH